MQILVFFDVANIFVETLLRNSSPKLSISSKYFLFRLHTYQNYLKPSCLSKISKVEELDMLCGVFEQKVITLILSIGCLRE